MLRCKVNGTLYYRQMQQHFAMHEIYCFIRSLELNKLLKVSYDFYNFSDKSFLRDSHGGSGVPQNLNAWILCL